MDVSFCKVCDNLLYLYENEDILVTHNIATFENGSREAILQSHLKKDGLLWRIETGATPLKKESN